MMDVEPEAVVDEQTIRLSEVFDLKTGSRIMFHATPDSLVGLRCGNVSMYMGKMGRKGNQIAIKIEGKSTKTTNPSGGNL